MRLAREGREASDFQSSMAAWSPGFAQLFKSLSSSTWHLWPFSFATMARIVV
ncbi:hypothetical protein Bca4012_058861 [Brassica carinata]